MHEITTALLTNDETDVIEKYRRVRTHGYGTLEIRVQDSKLVYMVTSENFKPRTEKTRITD